MFRAGVNLVRLDVRVVDEAGRAVTDLRQDEVAISEASDRRPILLFQRVAGAGASYVESAQRTIASDVSTNQGAPQGQLFVLVFDQDHIRSGNEQPVRIAADAFLRDRVRPHDRVAIYGLPGPGPAQPFTANVQAARQQLAHVRGGLERRASGAVTEMTVAEAYEILRNNEQVIQRYTAPRPQDAGSGGSANTDDLVRRFGGDPAVVRRLIRENAQTIVNRADVDARRFLQSLVDLLHGFRGIDGRKTVMVFSEGFYPDNIGRDLEDVAAAAAETYSVIYTFDLNRRTDVTSAVSSADDGMETDNRTTSLGSLAAETSGQLLKDAGTRLESALGALLPDDGGYYLIGFEPAAPETGDSAYRRVKVQVSRPGARVISRTGYAIGATPTPADRRASIDTALRAPFTQQALRLEYTTYQGQAAAAGLQRVVVSLVAELPVRPADAAAAGDHPSADVVFVVRNSRTGQVAASGSERLPLPVRTAAGFSTGTSQWHVGFDLPAGDYLMRCVVREPGGIIGSADRRFRVRALDGAEVTSSDLILVSHGETLAVRARGYTEGTLIGTTRLYGPSAAKLSSVVARLELTPNVETPELGDIGRAIDGTVEEVVATGRSFTRDVRFAMPLEKLADGAYVARATLRVDGELVADLRRPVDVIVGAPPAAAAADARATGRPRDVLDGEPAQRLVRQVTSSPVELHRRAAANVEKRQWAEVLSDLQHAPAEDAVALVLRGLAQIGREEYSAGAASLGAAFDRRSTDAPLAFVLGWARIGAADRTGAISAFRNAARQDPRMVPAYLALATTYVDLGHPELAVQSIEAGLRELPESRELRAALAALRGRV